MRRSLFGVLFCALLFSAMLPHGAAADDITLSGVISFNSLDGSADDHDGAANGVFTVNDGNLVIDGTIQCNDDPPLSGSGAACPIRLSVSGDLVLNPGGAIVAENRRGSGNGGAIEVEVGGDLVLRGPSGGLPGALISSSRTTGSGGIAGAISATVAGTVEMETGSTVAANNPTGRAGLIEIEAGGAIRVAGLIVSGPSPTLLSTRWKSGAVLDGGSSAQIGGSIVLRSTSADEPGIRIEGTGTLASQGQSSGSQLVLLEACGIEVHGLLAAISKDDTPARVALRSGKGILVDGTDLADVPGPRSGRLRADSVYGGAAAHLVDLFAQGDIQVLGPPSSMVNFVALSANPGTQLQRTGGSISAISRGGALLAHGNVAEAGRVLTGNKGGKINLQAAGDVDLEDAVLRAVGGYTTASNARRGGQISVRSYQGEVRWAFGTGDVRPAGSGATVSSRGTIALTACAGIDTTGTSFPVLGSPVAPFPVETDGVCSPAAPSLPSGEPQLPVCNVPPVADGQSVTTDEDTAVTITLTGSDPSGDSLTFSIVTPPAHGSLGPLTSPTATSVQVVYTPDADYNGSDSFVFQVNDGHGGTDTATVEITIEAVDDAPGAVDDEATVTEGSGPSSIDVLANDTDIDDGPKSIASVTQPANGTVVVAADGLSLTYQPNADYCNTPPGTTLETFTYTLSPAGADPTATVSVTVNCVDDEPTAVPDSATVPEDAPATTIDVLANDTDPDGGPKSIGSVTQPANGAVAIAGDGLSLTYKPIANYCNTPPGTLLETFTYTLDPAGPTPTATVTVAVTCVDDAPEAVADAASVDEDAPPTTIDVLANDTDIDGGAKSVASVTQPGNGLVEILPGGTALTYKPNANYCNNPPGTAPDTFTYTLSPMGSTPTATVSVLVDCFNDAPVLANPAIGYTVLGNTQLRVGEITEGASVLHLRDNQDVKEKSIPSDVDGPGPITVVPFSGNTGKGDLALNSDGTFTYEPNAGFEGTDVITFQVTDNGSPAAVSNGTLTITVSHTIWYVHDVTGENNPEPADTGRSTNAFEDLEDVAAVLTDNDYIYVFEGNSATTPHGGIRISKTGVKLIGAGVALNVPGFGNLIDPGNQPRIVNSIDVPAQEDHGVAVDATAASLSGVEIRGLNISGRDNGIDVTVAGTNSVGVNISNSTITSDGTAGLEGIDVNANSTGTTTVTVSNNSLTGRGNAFDARTGAAGALQIDLSNNTNILSSAGSGVVIDGSGGTTTITNFTGNSVHPDTVGTGISVTNATFDQTPGGTFQPVFGGNTLIGVAGNGVGGAGMVLTNIQGHLSFADLDIFANSGAGLRASSTSVYTGSAGLQLAVSNPGFAVIEANGGPAVDVTQATISLPLSSLKSTSSSTTGVALNSVAGLFSAGAGSSISNITSASGAAFQVGSSSAVITYGGTITTNQGTGVSLTSNSGTIGFTGTLTLSTGSNPAFTASGGGTVTATDTASILTTTTATALNVANTTIGAGGLRFRSITAGTAGSGPASGILLNNTGSSGGLTVSGSGSAGSGGTIQRAGTGISLTSTRDVSLSHMQLNDFTDFGIRGSSVVNFTLANTTINGTNGDNSAADEGCVRFTGLTGSATISNSSFSGSVEDTFSVVNSTGTLNRITFTNTTFGLNHAATGDNGLRIAGSGSAVMNATVQNNAFTGSRADHFDATLATGSTGSLDVVFTGNTVSNNHPSIVAGGGGVLIGGVSGTVTYNVSGGTFRDATGDGLVISCGGPGSTCSGRIEGVQIGVQAVANSGSTAGSGIALVSVAGGSFTSLINNNVIRQYNNHGIRIQAGDLLGNTLTHNLTVTNNTIGNPGSLNTNFNGIHLNNGTVSTDSFTTCVDIRNNSIAGSGQGAVAPNNADYRLRQRQSTTVRLPGYGGANNNDAAVVAFVSGNQTTVGTGAASNTVGLGGGGFVGGAACPTP